jgi:hypothetical protein
VKRGRQKGGQLISQVVDEQLGHLMRPRAQVEHRNPLGEWIDGHPEPQDLRVAAQACSQFIQLQMRDLEMARSERSCKVWACAPACSSQLVIVACLIPKTRSAADRSSPSAKAPGISSTRCDGVLSRYNGVWSRALKVVRHA